MDRHVFPRFLNTVPKTSAMIPLPPPRRPLPFLLSFLAAAATVSAEVPAPSGLMRQRFLTLNTVVRVRQIEVTRDTGHGEDESAVHSPAEGDVRRGHRLDQVHGRRHRSLGKKLPSPLLLRVQGKHKQRRDPKRCEKTGVGHRRKVNGSGRGK